MATIRSTWSSWPPSLEILSESEHAVTFRCGGDSRLTVSASTTGTADEQTQAAWRVENLEAELPELRSRGVEIMEYDTPELNTEDGIVDTGDTLHAWIVDPGRTRSGSISTDELMLGHGSRLCAPPGLLAHGPSA